VNAVALLMGLLVLSYLGSFLVSRRSAGGVGLPSGIEYATLGFALGPHALDLVAAKDISAFEPVAQVALGWLAFGLGLDFGFADEKRVRLSRIALGSFGALLTGCAVAGATWYLVQRLGVGTNRIERILLAGGVGAVCCETTRHSIAWVAGSQKVSGPLANVINDIAHADDLLPLVAVAILFALDPSQGITLPVPIRDWSLVTAALGLVLGAGAALLMRSEMPVEDTWAALFGVSLLVIGTAARLALSTLTASFFMGLAVSAFSRRGARLRAMVRPTEHPVLLPALVLAGARVDFRVTSALPWIAAVAIVVRLVTKVVLGWALAAGSMPARKAGPLVGLSLSSSGALSMCIGLAFALRFPGLVGDSVLAVAIVSAIVGEFVGPARLRRALLAAGELEETSPSPEPGHVAA
jgi:Kef-type K+ transport system membrane component KefB